MNKTIHLTFALLKTSFDLGIGAKGKKTSKKKTGLVTVLLATLFIASFSLPIVALVNDLVGNLATVNLPDIVWYMVLPIASISISLLSLFTVISIMFLSNDNKILLFLPLTPRQIITSRFLVVLIYTYLIELILLVPILIGYGIALSLPISFYLIGIINLLLIPVIPLALIVLLMSYLLRFTNLSKYRDAFTYIAMGLVLSLALSFNYFFTQAIGTIELDPTEIISNIRSLLDVYGNVINRFFPYLTFSLKSIIEESLLDKLLNLFILLIINGVVFSGVVLFVGPIYLKTISGSDERRKGKKNGYVIKSASRNSFISLIILEWRTLVRSPIYFLNLVFIVFLLPVIIIGSVFFGTSASGTQIDVAEVIALLNGLEFNFNNPFFVSILLAIGLFLGSTTFIAPTAISRLGGSAPFFKALPINYLDFINFKTFWANVLTIGPLILYITATSIFGYLGVFEAALLSLTIIPLFTLLNYLGLMIDLLNPKLDWLSEAQAVKQNFNAIFYMLGVWAITGLVVYSGYLINELNLPINGYIFSLIVFLISLTGNLAVIVYFKKRGYKLFKGVS